jgi:hypothetical protein
VGYDTALHLNDVKIKSSSVPDVKRALANPDGRGLKKICGFLEQAVIDEDGFLTFRASDEYLTPYDPGDDGTVPALIGKWYESEKIAGWLKRHSEKGGRLINHSCEGDGEAWGWEFNGRGKMREIGLGYAGKWQ